MSPADHRAGPPAGPAPHASRPPDARRLAEAPEFESDGPIILYDGVCNLCNASVRFVADRDRALRFRFAFLQSRSGEALLQRHGLEEARNRLDSVLLVEDGRVYDKSTAALRIARQLDGLWPALFVFIALPRALRDRVYDFIGRRRYRWFGKTDECQIPRNDLRARLLP